MAVFTPFDDQWGSTDLSFTRPVRLSSPTPQSNSGSSTPPHPPLAAITNSRRPRAVHDSEDNAGRIPRVSCPSPEQCTTLACSRLPPLNRAPLNHLPPTSFPSQPDRVPTPCNDHFSVQPSDAIPSYPRRDPLRVVPPLLLICSLTSNSSSNATLSSMLSPTSTHPLLHELAEDPEPRPAPLQLTAHSPSRLLLFLSTPSSSSATPVHAELHALPDLNLGRDGAPHSPLVPRGHTYSSIC